MLLKNVPSLKLIGKESSIIPILLKGLGQIMLQENALSGFLFLIGIFYGSVTMGFAALLAVASGTVTAILLKYDRSEIDKGLYGFSAALVGVGVIVFLKPLFICWILIAVGAIAATLLQHYFIKRKIPVFTLPFVLVLWLILYLAHNYFSGILIDPSISVIKTTNHFIFAFNGFGQVIFQDNFVSGLIFFVAVFFNSPISALYGLVGAILSAVAANYFSAPVEDIAIGLFSYNAVLCAITFAGSDIKDSIWLVISVILSIAISLLMFHYSIIQLTFPFVLASCLTQVFKQNYTLVTSNKNKYDNKNN